MTVINLSRLKVINLFQEYLDTLPDFGPNDNCWGGNFYRFCIELDEQTLTYRPINKKITEFLYFMDDGSVFRPEYLAYDFIEVLEGIEKYINQGLIVVVRNKDICTYTADLTGYCEFLKRKEGN